MSFTWAGPLEWGLTAGLLVLAVGAAVAVARQHVRSRVALTVALLAATIVLTGARAIDKNVLPHDPWPSEGYAAVLAIASTIGAVGVFRRVVWARWLVLALGSGGTATGVINLVSWGRAIPDHEAAVEVPAWLASGMWTSLLLTSGAALLVVLVAGHQMRDAFGRPFSPEEPATVWRAPSPLVRAVKLTVTVQLVAAAMSLLYAWGQPVVPATTRGAVVVAIVFVVALTFTLARKTVGVLLLLLTGLGFFSLAAVTVAAARASAEPDVMHIALFYAFFWGAAGLSAVVCGAALGRQLLRTP